MLRQTLPLLALLACAPDPVADGVDGWPSEDHDGWNHLPSDQAAAPFDMTLTATPAIRGQVMTFTTEGAQPNGQVGFVLSTSGLGMEPCPAVLQGTCMNLALPTTLVSIVPNTPDGASLSLTVPMSVPAGTIVWMQAGSPDGLDAHTSNTLEFVVDDDDDGDGVPNGLDACPFDTTDDDDGDGICNIDDQCIGFDQSGDDDNDGVCNDQDACPGVDDFGNFAGVVDLPDAQGIDDNCDGIDGDLDLAVFVDGSAAPGGDGSIDMPISDLQTAIDVAAVLGKYVLVDRAPLVGPITLIDGVDIYGGYVANQGWLRDSDEPATITGGNPALVADGLTVPTTVDLLDFVADDATGIGASSYGATVLNSGANLTLSRVSITAGDGTDGRSGTGGAVDANGAAGNAGEAGCDIELLIIGGCSSTPGEGGARRTCSPTGTSGGRGTFDFAGDGGSGGNSTDAGSGGLNGLGGSPGDTQAGAAAGGSGGQAGQGGNAGGQRLGCGFLGLGCCDEVDAGDGGDGQDGGDGAPGASGIAGGDFGGVASDQLYITADGTGGRDGGAGGQGGGGGGGGGAGCDFGCCIADIGGAGGGGASGGCGGSGADPGTGGGGSFGLWSVNSSPVLDDVTLVSARGGAGGGGQNGGAGGVAGFGGDGGFGFELAGAGGDGGDGGQGGRGGDSGAGGGGPSVGLFSSGGTASILSVDITVGQGGPGGSGSLTGATGRVAEIIE